MKKLMAAALIVLLAVGGMGSAWAEDNTELYGIWGISIDMPGNEILRAIREKFGFSMDKDEYGFKYWIYGEPKLDMFGYSADIWVRPYNDNVITIVFDGWTEDDENYFDDFVEISGKRYEDIFDNFVLSYGLPQTVVVEYYKNFGSSIKDRDIFDYVDGMDFGEYLQLGNDIDRVRISAINKNVSLEMNLKYEYHFVKNAKTEISIYSDTDIIFSKKVVTTPQPLITPTPIPTNVPAGFD